MEIERIIKDASDDKKYRNFQTRTIAIFMLLVVAGILIFLAVYFSVKQQDKQEKDELCDDTAVIGAGIGGSYLAWRLRDRNMSVSVYEYSDRVGGRLHTVRFRNIPDINAELGGMRFHAEVHHLLKATILSLGLTITDFRPNLGTGDDDLMYIRGKHFRRGDIITKGPYNLNVNEKEMKNENDLRWSILLNGTDYTPDKPINNDDVLMFTKTNDGVDLYKQSSQMTYASMGVSEEAVQLFKDSQGLYSFLDDTSASYSIPRDNPETLTYPLHTVEEGMQAIPLKMIEEFLKTSDSFRGKVYLAVSVPQ